MQAIKYIDQQWQYLTEIPRLEYDPTGQVWRIIEWISLDGLWDAMEYAFGAPERAPHEPTCKTVRFAHLEKGKQP